MVYLNGNQIAHRFPLHVLLTQKDLQAYSTFSAAIAVVASAIHCAEDEVIIGPGVDILLHRIIPILGERVARVLLAYPSYPLYRHVCERSRLVFQEISTIDLVDRAREWPPSPADCAHALVVIANPENPTGLCVPRAVLMATIRAAPTALFVVDESYVDYAPGASLLEEDDRPDNLLVLRGFSKGLGLPGLRIGVGITTNTALRDLYFARYRSMDLSGASLATLKSAQDSWLFRAASDLDRRWRAQQAQRVVRAMHSLGIAAADSVTNLVFARVSASLEDRIAVCAHEEGLVYTRKGQSDWLDSYYQGLTAGGMGYMRFSCGAATRPLLRALQRAAG